MCHTYVSHMSKAMDSMFTGVRGVQVKKPLSWWVYQSAWKSILNCYIAKWITRKGQRLVGREHDNRLKYCCVQLNAESFIVWNFEKEYLGENNQGWPWTKLPCGFIEYRNWHCKVILGNISLLVVAVSGKELVFCVGICFVYWMEW